MPPNPGFVRFRVHQPIAAANEGPNERNDAGIIGGEQFGKTNRVELFGSRSAMHTRIGIIAFAQIAVLKDALDLLILGQQDR